MWGFVEAKWLPSLTVGTWCPFPLPCLAVFTSFSSSLPIFFFFWKESLVKFLFLKNDFYFVAASMFVLKFILDPKLSWDH